MSFPDKRSTHVLGACTAAAAKEKVQKKKNGESIIVEVKPVEPEDDASDVVFLGENEPPPDGGFRAWLVVFGVSSTSNLTNFSR